MKKYHVFFLVILVSGCSTPEHVDLIVHNAAIYSVDAAMSVHEAMAVKDGKVVAIGPEHEILNKYTAGKSIDAQKHPIFPGFIDSHCHFLGYGLVSGQINLRGTHSFDEVVRKIMAFAEDDTSRWIIGRGWDQNHWPGAQYPTNDTLSELFPGKFIVLKRIDGHAALVSENVLKKAGLSTESVILGGSLLKEGGKLTGLLTDEAMTPVEAILPTPDLRVMTEALLRAQEACFKWGLTTVDDAGLTPDQIQVIRDLQESRLLKMRVYAMLSASPEVMKNLEGLKYKSEALNVRSVKIYADGALGSRGAHLLHPYTDDSDHQGSMITSADSLHAWAKACNAAGMQMNVHCIGDHANQVVLDVMGEVLKDANDKRWRIEHAQVVSPEDLKKFGAFNILPSVQPTHATSDMYWVEERLGKDRMKHAYAYKSLLAQNGLIALGTDFPVEKISPIKTFYAAIVRKDSLGFPHEGFHPGEALKRDEALRGMTIWGAIANFEEEEKGSLELGKVADFVILDNDIMTCGESEIPHVKILQTWINGELVYEH